jgi:hypothetical protein
MAKIGLSIKSLFVVVAGLIVVGLMLGCGVPQGENRTAGQSNKNARVEEISGAEIGLMAVKESKSLPNTEADLGEKVPTALAATREFVGPAPNMAYLEFFEALNVRYGGSAISKGTGHYETD